MQFFDEGAKIDRDKCYTILILTIVQKYYRGNVKEPLAAYFLIMKISV